MSTQLLRGLVAAAILILFLLGTEVAPWADEDPILFRQGESQGQLFPITGKSSAEEFYNYSLFDYQAKTSLEIPRHGMIALYRNVRSDKLALIIILNAPNAGPAGQVRLDIQGLPSTAKLAVQDDPNDEYTWNPPNAQFYWRWASGRTDGVVITDLEEPFMLRITPQVTQGITGWKLYTLKNPDVGAERVPLGSLMDPITLWVGEGPVPQVGFRYSPERVHAMIPVLFDAQSSQALCGQNVHYEWDFDGDGFFEVGTDQSMVTHTFAQSGTFKVTLRITSPNGCTVSVSRTIEVSEERTGAWRTISTPQAQPGSVFRVTIDLPVEVPTNGLGLEEQLPIGWTLEPIRNDGAIFKFTHARGQWIFPALLKVGDTKRIVYDVRVPTAKEVAGPPLPARYAIQGSVTSASPAYVVPIGGESEIEIVSCLGMPVAISHLDLQSGQVDLRGSETITTEQLTRAVDFWANSATVPGTCDTPMTSDALLQTMMYPLRSIPVDQALPPLQTDPTSPPVTVSRTITTPLPAGQVYLSTEGSNVFEVELAITVNQDSPGLKLSEQLSEEWQIEPHALLNAVFKAGATNEWIFPELLAAGQTRRVVYEVIVPSDVDAGTVEFKGTAESGFVTFLTPVEGDHEIEVIRCLSLPLAIAHLNVSTGEIDMSLDNVISRSQSQAAFKFWFEDREVPGTCGQKMDLATLQSIIRAMVSGTPVEK